MVHSYQEVKSSVLPSLEHISEIPRYFSSMRPPQLWVSSCLACKGTEYSQINPTDSQSEAQIQEAISKASRQRTTIMIAHRLTSVQRADRILVFDQGTIVEEGRHEELARGGGIYEQMIKAQSLG
jgi:hypothetical protein